MYFRCTRVIKKNQDTYTASMMQSETLSRVQAFTQVYAFYPAKGHHCLLHLVLHADTCEWN